MSKLPRCRGIGGFLWGHIREPIWSLDPWVNVGPSPVTPGEVEVATGDIWRFQGIQCPRCGKILERRPEWLDQ